MKKRIYFFLFVISLIYSGAYSQINYVVTSANDPVNPFNTVPGELRWAIQQANASPGIDYIDFNISAVTFPIVINLQSDLPLFSDPIIIDGNTQNAPGYTGLEPKITIDGTNTLVFTLELGPGSTGSSVKNLTLIGSQVYFALGINSNNNQILDNVFLCKLFTCYFYAADYNIFKGNYVGTDRALSNLPQYNNSPYLLYFHSSNYNTVGGLNSGEANYLYNSNLSGAMIEYWWGSTYNRTSGNIFINNIRNISLTSSSPVGNNNKQAPIYQALISGGLTTINGSSGPNDFIEVYKSNATGIDAVQLIGTATANSAGQWIITSTALLSGDIIVATATDPLNNTSVFSPAVIVIPPCCNLPGIVPTGFSSWSSNIDIVTGVGTYYATVCSNQPFSLNIPYCTNPNPSQAFSWDFGDGSPIVTANPGTHQYASLGSYVITSTIYGSNCMPIVQLINVTVVDCSCSGAVINIPSGGGCVGVPVPMNVTGCPDPTATYNWNFGDGGTATGIPVNHTYSSPGTYNITCTIIHPPFAPNVITSVITIGLCNNITPCKDCIGSFSPGPGDYIISLWVKEDRLSTSTSPVTTYPNAGVQLSFVGDPTVYGPFFPNVNQNKIIDGWQRIEAKFSVPTAAQKINIELINNYPNSSGIDCYYDDIRIHPINSNMKSYVYDPVTLRLSAELDENNYATFYEYDEEGKLIRVKKETERGIMTIKEARNNTKKN